jgi:hypothetical protein
MGSYAQMNEVVRISNDVQQHIDWIEQKKNLVFKGSSCIMLAKTRNIHRGIWRKSIDFCINEIPVGVIL